MDAVPEIVLQRYIKDKFQQFQSYFQKHYNAKISYVRSNPIKEDKFPDLYFVLEDKREIPVEVEWKTSKFDHAVKNGRPNPEFMDFVAQDGLVFVAIEEKNASLGSIKQVQIDLDKFEKWYISNSKKIVRDAIKPLRDMKKQRRLPKMWYTLLTKKGDALKHFEPALKYETWGIQKNYQVNSETRLEGIQKDDVIVFLVGLHGSFVSKNTGTLVGGRYPLPEWIKKTFNGYFDYICAFRVTSDYFYDERNGAKIWTTNPNSKWKNELFPHRFNFDKNPLLILEHLKISKLSLTTKKELHSIVYSNIGMCEPNTFVDILHNAKQVKITDYGLTLKLIPKL